MDYLPIHLNLKKQPCLVVGGGEVAARKVRMLRRAGAHVIVVAPTLTPWLAQLAAAGDIAAFQREFEDADVRDVRLIVSATDRRRVNEQVAESARKHGIPVNVVDCPALCTFIMPAIIDRSPILITVSSGGTSPVLARLLRTRLEAWIPSGFGSLAKLAQRFREEVKHRLHDPMLRRRFWESALSGPVADLALAGRENHAEAALRRNLAHAERNDQPLGMVYLVGAGPGDPDLLTLRALRLIQEADVVVYDRLVSAEVMELVRREAETIYAGKERSRHTLPQETINSLLAELAKRGKRVVRLKGGDPFMFGRGGEEIETLMDQGIPFQVIPGITAAAGCAAYAGIPLTHREYAHSCTFVAGYLKEGTVTGLNFAQLAQPDQTVVIYMGLQGLGEICVELIRHGAPPDLPAALIQQGTTRHQRVVEGSLANLPRLVAEAGLKAPTLAIIGQVVRLHRKLDWFGGSGQGTAEG